MTRGAYPVDSYFLIATLANKDWGFQVCLMSKLFLSPKGNDVYNYITLSLILSAYNLPNSVGIRVL